MKNVDGKMINSDKHKMEIVAQREQLSSLFLSILNRKYVPHEVEDASVFNSEFYKDLHENNPAYQTNNWFLEKYVNVIRESGIKSVFELGSGNGKATVELAKHCDMVYACDWNQNPYEHLPNVDFYNCSFFDVPDEICAEVTISADVMEHFPCDAVSDLIKKLQQIAPKGLHIIAGYPDGMSHLSVFGPWKWLELFRQYDPGYQLIEIDFRKGNLNRPVFVFSNFL